MLGPEAADAGAEEAPDLSPPRGDRATENGQARTDVQLPGWSGQPGGDEEVEHRDSAAGPDDSRDLPHRGGRVVDVTEEIREGESVERGVRERKVLGLALTKLDPSAQSGRSHAFSAGGQHRRALVDPHHAAPVAAYELEGDRGCAAGDVEDGLLGRCGDALDKERAPPWILAEGEEPRVAIVGLAERGEERLSRPVALAEALGHGAIVAAVSLEVEIAAAAEAASAHAAQGEELEGVVPAEPGRGARVYLCAFRNGDEQTWLALDAECRPVADRALVREAVSIAAMCELAEESAGGEDLGELRARLVELRLTEAPEGIEEAELAAAQLQETLQPAPRVASVGYLDAIGLAAARLEQALGQMGGSPFAEAMRSGMPAADELATEVIRSYKGSLA